MRASVYIPPAAMHHAMMAPKGPVAFPNVLGREKIPDPTMDPTTMAVSVNSGSFCTDAELSFAEGDAAAWLIGPPFLLRPHRSRAASRASCRFHGSYRGADEVAPLP